MTVHVGPWSAWEDDRLRGLVAEGYTAKGAAAVLNRTEDSAKKRAERLGLSFQGIRRKRNGHTIGRYDFRFDTATPEMYDD